jgi:chromosome segregation ATPase
MSHVFGSTLVCSDLKLAEKVAFDPAVRMKTVTLEGDQFDPKAGAALARGHMQARERETETETESLYWNPSHHSYTLPVCAMNLVSL